MRYRIGLGGLVRDIGAGHGSAVSLRIYYKNVRSNITYYWLEYGRTRQCRFPTDILQKPAIEHHLLLDQIRPDTAVPFP
jgi:hypothetical protein